ncbi:MAG: IS630 family transposase [Deltaproteobacteria bacterium]|nr:IS630 family transposase [Deltaproteobacteria bacterium]
MREIYAEWQRGIDSHRLVFLDESGSTLAMTREYARSPRGERADDKVPRNRGTVITMLGALTCEGMKAMMTVEGATTTEVFETYVKCVLLPSLDPGDVVVLDNLGAHRAGSVRHLFREAGVRLKYLPPYSPDLNPIEMAWAKLKQYLKEAKARTHDALCEATRVGMETISSSDAENWLRHCGYALAQ